MPTPRRAKRLTVIISENDRHRHKKLYDEIVRCARDAGLAGASVSRGIEGYGATGRIHTTRILDLSQDLPLAIVIVDLAERVDAFLPMLEGLIPKGLVVVDEVEMIRYGGQEPEPDAGGG